jgi:DNA-binding HxlR family transcriptional regulator
MRGSPANEKAGSRRQAEPSGSDLSPLAEALASVGDRWTLLVVAALMEGPRRFNDLLGEISGIAPNILTQRLRHLERHALVVAQPYSRRPPRSVYELTEAGRQLAGALRLLTDWGARHSEGVDAPRHGACGTPMDARWYCPTCERPVDPNEADLYFL